MNVNEQWLLRSYEVRYAVINHLKERRSTVSGDGARLEVVSVG